MKILIKKMRILVVKVNSVMMIILIRNVNIWWLCILVNSFGC